MQLIQPQFKCAGRNDTVCFYRGKVSSVADKGLVIEFNYKKEKIYSFYYFESGFLIPELKDIKIV